MILSHLTVSLATLARSAALSAVLALPAAAATMQAVYTGTVTSSDDRTGVFGGTGSSLDDEAFTMTFRYDTAEGETYDIGYYQNLSGGPLFGTISPVFYAALTINGVTQTLDLSANSSISVRDESVLGVNFSRTDIGHFGKDFFLTV